MPLDTSTQPSFFTVIPRAHCMLGSISGCSKTTSLMIASWDSNFTGFFFLDVANFASGFMYQKLSIYSPTYSLSFGSTLIYDPLRDSIFAMIPNLIFQHANSGSSFVVDNVGPQTIEYALSAKTMFNSFQQNLYTSTGGIPIPLNEIVACCCCCC